MTRCSALPSVLITGGEGQVGRELQRSLLAHSIPFYAPGRDELDITNSSQMEAVLESKAPDIVVHAAAWTDVDGCEGDPDRASRVNAQATASLASLCAIRGIFLLYLSSDFVFDGRKRTPYEIEDVPNPVNVYGRSKWAGEEAIRQAGCAFAIVRTSWVYGIYGDNFPKSILRAAAARRTGGANGPIRVVSDQIGSPTYAGDLAAVLLRLLGLHTRPVCPPRNGVFHVANAGQCSRFDFAREVVQQAGWDVSVQPITSAELARPAQRPAYSVLSLRSIEDLQFKIAPWEVALKRFMNELRSTEPELFP